MPRAGRWSGSPQRCPSRRTSEMVSQAERYKSTAHEFLARAKEALARGELLRVSEKGWGAAAQALKAAAEQRGWAHNGTGSYST